MRVGQITVASLALFTLVSSSCNSLTGIESLPARIGLGGESAGGSQVGGRGQVPSGGMSATGGARESGGTLATGGAEDMLPSGGRGPEAVGGSDAGGGATGGGATGGGATAGGGAKGSGGGGTGGTDAAGGNAAGGTDAAGGATGGASPVGLPLLDDFSMPLDTGRWVQLFDFGVSSGTVSCSYCGDALLWNEVFPLPQAASVRLVSFSEHAAETNVVLVAASNRCDLIEVLYSPASAALSILSCQGGTWAIHESRPLLVGSGSVLEGRVRAASEGGGVSVQALVNGQLSLQAEFEFVNTMGYIGISGVCSGEACQAPTVFDDFRGGVVE